MDWNANYGGRAAPNAMKYEGINDQLCKGSQDTDPSKRYIASPNRNPIVENKSNVYSSTSQCLRLLWSCLTGPIITINDPKR